MFLQIIRYGDIYCQLGLDNALSNIIMVGSDWIGIKVGILKEPNVPSIPNWA